MQLWFKMRSWIALANGDHRSLNSSSIVDQAISDRPPTTPVAILHLGKDDQRSLPFIHRAACEDSSAIDLNIVSPFWFMHSGADHLRAAADDDVFMSSQVLPT